MKKIINLLVAMCLLLTLSVTNELLEDSYWGYNSSKVEAAKVDGRITGTTFQIEFNKKQYTITNLHICRIPNMIEKERRDDYNFAQIVKGEKPSAFPPLKDTDLIGQKIQVGEQNRKILKVDEEHDLCILEGNINLVPFDLSSSYEVGESIRVIGYPRGLGKIIHKGRIFSKEKGYFPWLKRTTEYLYANVIGYPGNSGSPVLNKYGRVIGVVFAGDQHHTEMMIVPLEYLKDFLNKNI